MARKGHEGPHAAGADVPRATHHGTDRQIDAQVYELDGLTEEKIVIVVGGRLGIDDEHM